MFEEKNYENSNASEIFVDTEKLINSTMEAEAEAEAVELKEATVEVVDIEDIPESVPVENIEEKAVEVKEKACDHDFEALKGGIHRVFKGIPHYYKKFKCKKCGIIEEKRV